MIKGHLPQNDFPLSSAIGSSVIASNASLFLVDKGGGPVNETFENSLTKSFGLVRLSCLGHCSVGVFDFPFFVSSIVYSVNIPGRNMTKLKIPVMAPTYLEKKLFYYVKSKVKTQKRLTNLIHSNEYSLRYSYPQAAYIST